MIGKRRLFRTQALAHYAQNKQKDILPGFVTPPVFLCLWLLLLLIGATTFLAWQERVPTYIQVRGIILEQQHEPVTALLFIPSGSVTNMAVGQEITLQVNALAYQFQARVTSIDPGAITPNEASSQYGLTGDAKLVITQPSTVAHVNLTPQQASQVIDHLSITAQIQVSSRSLLSLLPGLLGNAFGG